MKIKIIRSLLRMDGLENVPLVCGNNGLLNMKLPELDKTTMSQSQKQWTPTGFHVEVVLKISSSCKAKNNVQGSLAPKRE